MLDILKSRKFRLLASGVTVGVFVMLVPDLEGERVLLVLAVSSLFAAAMGMHTLTDITAIKSEADKS